MGPRLGDVPGLFLLCAALFTACGRIGYDPTDLGTPEASLPGTGGRSSDDASPGTGGELREAAADQVAPIPDASSDSSVTDGPSPPRDVSPPPAEASLPEASAESGVPVCGGATTWSFSFDSDPTLADSNGDGVLDWVMRNATTFPLAELSSGVWRSETRIVLDSRPLDDFSGRTVVDVRMGSATVPASGRGAVFWVNLNEGSTTFSALFVSLSLETDGTQTLTLFGKPDNVTETPLATVSGLSPGLKAIHLDVDPVALTVALTVEGVGHGTHAIPLTGAPNGDRFATLLAWDGIAEFDSVRIVRCPAP